MFFPKHEFDDYHAINLRWLYACAFHGFWDWWNPRQSADRIWSIVCLARLLYPPTRLSNRKKFSSKRKLHLNAIVPAFRDAYRLLTFVLCFAFFFQMNEKAIFRYDVNEFEFVVSIVTERSPRTTSVIQWTNSNSTSDLTMNNRDENNVIRTLFSAWRRQRRGGVYIFDSWITMDIAQQVPQHPRVRDVLADQCQRLFFEYLER